MDTTGYTFHETGGAPVKSWTTGVPFDPKAFDQVRNVASLPFIHKHVAVMPDVHWGIGATVGSVIPTARAIVPAAVGVDIGCGMVAQRTSLTADDLPDSLAGVRERIEKTVPVGRAAWPADRIPDGPADAWKRKDRSGNSLRSGLRAIDRDRDAKKAVAQLGTLGGGNHFVEVCLDEDGRVWAMLHSGSRGTGNVIGREFIERAKEEMRRHYITLPDADLAYLVEDSDVFDQYVAAVGWAQRYAAANREVMLAHTLAALAEAVRPFDTDETAIDCHHNYVAREHHFGANVWVTRKGAVRARRGDLGIVPGSMGARSYIVEGLGNADSFESCSHGAGRALSRTEARRRITVEQHAEATAGVECRKDERVVDESPGAYKDIDAVMAAQADLVTVRHTLKQVVCVKG